MDLFESNSPSYTGSRLFESWVPVVGLPIDKINFLVAQATSLVFAWIFRRFLSCPRYSNTVRHLALIIPSLTLSVFCFGYQVLNLITLTLICYVIIWKCNPQYVQHVTLAVSMMYLSYMHLMRQIYDYGNYSIDITGPTMIAVQRISSLAFSVHDGVYRKEDDLLPEEKKNAVNRYPSLVEMFGYIFQFPTIMAGPLIHFKDYDEFITGINYSKHISKKDLEKYGTPSPLIPVLQKLFVSVSFAVILIILTPIFPIESLADEKFLSSNNVWYILIYVYITTFHARFKYYHAWKLGETITYASGFGFNGFQDDAGDASNRKYKWDYLSSVDIYDFETSLSLRDALNLWNKTTQSWLRNSVYDRVPKYKTLLTYVLSALWHGFYPGYYCTFLSGALFTQAARSARRHLRPYFQGSRRNQLIYHCITFIGTRLAIAYLVFPFVLLELKTSIMVYARLYFAGHVIALILLYVLPLVAKGKGHKKSTAEKLHKKSQ